jgi:predicted SnoaL-like aldol condensation-catalyzing enzyme
MGCEFPYLRPVLPDNTEVDMTNRRFMLAALGAVSLIEPLRTALAAEACPSDSAAANSALLDRYVTASNAHDTSAFPEIFAEDYIQHSGRSPSGLAAQIANFGNLRKTWPDLQLHVEDRMFAGDKIIARTALQRRTPSLRWATPRPAERSPFARSISGAWRAASSPSTGTSSTSPAWKNNCAADSTQNRGGGD